MILQFTENVWRTGGDAHRDLSEVWENVSERDRFEKTSKNSVGQG